eukprot:Phypoly_transcript_01592.p1 GENE.Phypoly_transcript_01592~~Phypoly_transcript_01592.p1  ORF type:complete len:559 (+),score=73.49 Phypoly_transcript_01592:1534-3210(+)
MLVVSAEYYVEWHEDDYETFINTNVVVGGSFDPLPNWRKFNPGFESPVILVCTTGSLTASSQTILEVLPRNFTTLIIDESSQMWLGDLVPILEQHEKIKRLIMVGDHKQLPPYGSQQMEEAKLDSVSLFEECVLERRFEYQLLNQQYRMPGAIGGFISKSFYEGGITSIHRTPLPPCAKALTTNRVLWVHVEGKEEKSPDTRSSYNIAEITQVVTLVSYFTQFLTEPQRVVVIVPYEEQRARIESMLRDIPHLEKLFRNHTIVYCIDGYQGREADIVVTSLVRCNTKGNLGFLQSLNRLNVMLSRVKVFMCVVGSVPTVALSVRREIFRDLRSIAHLVTPAELQVSISRQQSVYPAPIPSVSNTSFYNHTSNAHNAFNSYAHSDPRTHAYAHTSDPYAHTSDPYAHTSDPYAHASDPYAHTPDPYARPSSSYAHTPDPYARPASSYARTPDLYANHSNPSPRTVEPYHPTRGQNPTPTIEDMFSKMTLTANEPVVPDSFWEFLCKNPKLKVSNLFHFRRIYKKGYLQDTKGPKFSEALRTLRQEGHITHSATTIFYKN